MNLNLRLVEVGESRFIGRATRPLAASHQDRHLFDCVRNRLRPGPGTVLRHRLGGGDRHHRGDRTASNGQPARSLFPALGGTVQRHPGCCFRGRALPDAGFQLRGDLRGSHHDGTNRRLLERYASQHGLFGDPAIAADAAADLGQLYANRGVHCNGAGVQRAGAARGSSLVLRDSSGRGDGIGDYGGRDGQPLYRILRRQSCGAAPGSVWNLAGATAASRCNRFNTGSCCWMLR